MVFTAMHTEPLHHPVFERLTQPCAAFIRHAMLHDLELQLSMHPMAQGLASRVRHFVERGVPYFAPADAHYRAWAAKAAQLWDELHGLDASVDAQPAAA
jgi:hypothetical protein